MTAPFILAVLDDTILVEYSQFTLQDFPLIRIALENGQPTDECRAVGDPGGSCS